MTRRRKYAPQRYYQDDDYRPYRQRRGFFYRVKRFFYGIFITFISIAVIIIVSILAYFGYVFRAYLPMIFLIIAGIAGVILLFFFLKWLVEIISSMSISISEARQRSIVAKKAKIELSRQKIARDEYKRQTLVKSSGVVRQPLAQPLRTRPLDRPPAQSQKLVRVLAEPTYNQTPPVKTGVPGMPNIPLVPYRAIHQQLQPGQLVALIRENKTARIEEWTAFKILLILGGSSSGKTSTMVEKILGFITGGGYIVPCDPHSSKEDSLFNKIYPAFEPALFPGATFAIGHNDILKNIRLVNAELEKRVHGSDSSIPVLLVVEELNRLLRDKQIAKEITIMLEALGEEARGFNIFVVVGCQRVTGLADIRKAFISYIVHRSDESEAQLIIPARYAKYAAELKTGQCFVKDADGVTEAGLQVYVSQQDIQVASKRLSARLAARVQLPQPPLTLPAQIQPHSPLTQIKRPTQPLRPRINTSQPLKKSRLSPIEPSTENLVPAPQNLLHTWSNEVTEDLSNRFIDDIIDTVVVPEPPQKPQTRVAEPVSEPLVPANANANEKLAMLAQLRKKSGKIARKDEGE